MPVRVVLCTLVLPRLMPFCCFPATTIFTTLELVRHPVGLVQPDHAAARGQPSTTPAADPVQLCPRVVVW